MTAHTRKVEIQNDMTRLNETHDPALRSWLASAHAANTDFPIQNLPFAVFRRKGEGWRGGVAIGDDIIDLAAVAKAGPARPRLAILLPSNEVTIVADSPGVFNKIEVVEPPYIAP